MSKFTGRVEFEWVPCPELGPALSLESLFCTGIEMGQVWRAEKPEPGAEWQHDYGVASTLEEGKAALLTALGIVKDEEVGL